MYYRKRLIYFIIIVLVIACGLLSRQIAFIPNWVGDFLYAVMIFFVLRFLLLRKGNTVVALLALSLCFIIEFSQLYQAPWLNTIRAGLPGRLILGQGFLWSDLIAYAAGITTAVFMEKGMLLLWKRR